MPDLWQDGGHPLADHGCYGILVTERGLVKDFERNIVDNIQRLFEQKYGVRCNLSPKVIHDTHRELSAGAVPEDEILEDLKEMMDDNPGEYSEAQERNC